MYLIYHVGKTQLYEGSRVFPSTDYPVYVGMSNKNISKRLNTHRNNIKAAIGEETGQEKQTDEEEDEQTDEEQEEQTEGKKLSENKQTERELQTEGVKMELSDFVVRFMIVDIEHYACCIESMLIEYFCSVMEKK